jgi:hypothetical protein
MKNPQRIVDSTFDRIQARNGLTAKNQSQMTKIIPLLQIGSKAGPDEAQVLAKMEKRLQALKDLKVSLQKAAARVADLHTYEKRKQVVKLTASLKAVKEIADSKPPVGVSKQLRACMNELISLREGVTISERMDRKTLSVIACTQAVEHVDALILSAKKNIARAKTEATGGLNDELLREEDAEMLRVLKQTQQESKNISQLKERQFVVTRVPIVPITKGFVSVDVMKSKGLKAENLGGYPVLHNQLVIGVNKTDLTGAKKSSKSLNTADFRDEAERIRKTIQKQTKVKYQFVDDRAYGAQGGAWFWLMPERELDQFASCFPGGKLQIQRWGFGF